MASESQVAVEAEQDPKRYYQYVQPRGFFKKWMRTIKWESRKIICEDEQSEADASFYIPGVWLKGFLGKQAKTLNTAGDNVLLEILIIKSYSQKKLEGLDANNSTVPDGMQPTIGYPLSQVACDCKLYGPTVVQRTLPLDWRVAAVADIEKLD